MGRYEFTIVLAGYGSTPDKAWDDAVENFMQEPGPAPEEFTFEEEEV